MKTKGKPSVKVGCLRLFLGVVIIVSLVYIVAGLNQRWRTEREFQAALDSQCPGKNYQISQGTFRAEFMETYQSWWVDKGLYCVQTYGYSVDCICLD